MTKRNTGIDLLRSVSMIMVLVLHILGQGGVLKGLPQGTIRYQLAWGMEIACYCAVNCFALISGYVGVNGKHRYSSILRLWLQVVFYTFGAALLLNLPIWGDGRRLAYVEDVADSLFPVTNRKYWYYTAYFCMSFFIPLLNHLLLTLPQKTLKSSVILMVVLFSLFPSWNGQDYFAVNEGYSALWLAILYLLGGYIRIYPPREHFKPRICFVLYFVCVLVTLAYKLVKDNHQDAFGNLVLIEYTSPTILAASILLLIGFSRIMIPQAVSPFIERIGQMSFATYLIHAQGLIYGNFMADQFGDLGKYFSVSMCGMVLLIAVGIFAICTLIELFRVRLFNAMKVSEKCLSLEAYLTKYWPYTNQE